MATMMPLILGNIPVVTRAAPQSEQEAPPQAAALLLIARDRVARLYYAQRRSSDPWKLLDMLANTGMRINVEIRNCPFQHGAPEQLTNQKSVPPGCR